MNSLYKTKKKKLLYLEDFSKAENILPDSLLLMTDKYKEADNRILCKFYYKNRHYIFPYIHQKDFDEIFECIYYV